jgi:hypothetical protein
MKRTKILWAFLAILLIPALTEARVTRIDITRQEPFANGMPFGETGPYEKLVGTAYLEVDPNDPLNAIIQDLDLVPPNAAGNVEFTTDIYILKPVDMRKGNGKIFFEVNNRGNKISPALMNDLRPGSNINDPSTPTDAGNGFLMREGYAIVWAGWEGDVNPGNNRMTIQLPIPTADGTPSGDPITELILVEFSDRNFGGGTPYSLPLSGSASFASYEAVSTDPAVAQAELRARPSDSFLPPQPSVAGIPSGTVVPTSDWSFAYCPGGPPGTPSTTDICLAGGFQNNKVYQLTYKAKHPRVMGLGYVATRDVTSFLRYQAVDDSGAPNPLGTGITTALGQGISSSGMYFRDYLFQGFNQDEQGDQVFDGLSIHIPGAHKLFLNYRFAQPNPYSVTHRDRYVPDVNFPVTYQVRPDPLLEFDDDGILRRCLETDTCPKIIHTDTSTEYWVFRSALLHTDVDGNDIPLPPEVRMFLLSATQHFTFKGSTPTFGTGNRQLQQLNNVTHSGVLMRALFIALDEWATQGVAPPDSRVPTVAAGTLVLQDQASVGWPDIPGVNYNDGLHNASGERDFGPRAPRNENRGIIDNLLPVVLSEHVNLVPKVNQVGIDMGGLNQPIVEVPVATLTGWNLRTAEFTENDLGDLSGMTIPLFWTEAERLAAGDPRPSLEELYNSHGGYVSRIAEAAQNLKAERFMLQEDVHRVINEAAQSDVLKGHE